MTTKQNAQALANTARECAAMADSVSGTIKSIVIHWNLCCQQSKLDGFTTEARYTRRAALAADMLRMAEQLDNMAEGKVALTGEEIETQRAAGYPVDEEGNDTREWCGNDIMAAHAEALEMDMKVDEALLALSSNPLSAGWHLHSPTMKEQAIKVAHVMALKMNALVDHIIWKRKLESRWRTRYLATWQMSDLMDDDDSYITDDYLYAWKAARKIEMLERA